MEQFIIFDPVFCIYIFFAIQNCSSLYTIQNFFFAIQKKCIANFLAWYFVYTKRFLQYKIWITISNFTSVRPYGVRCRCRPVPSVPFLSFQFLQAYDKVSPMKVGWYVLRVKNIHSWSPSPWFHETKRRQVTHITTLGERKLSYIY